MAEVEIYPSNSNKSKEASLIRESIEQPRTVEPQEKVVEIAPPPKRRISPVREVFAAIFPGGIQEVKDRIIWDVFVPWMQDAFRSGWDTIGDVIFPGSAASNNRRSSVPEHVSYDKKYQAPFRQVTYSDWEQYGMRPVTKNEADDILRNLRNIQRRYGVVTLLDFNELVGNQTRATQRAYGWIDLSLASTMRVGANQFVVQMPPAVPIDS